MAAGREAGAPVIAYGLYVSNLIDFVIVAFVLFLLIREINRLKRAAEEGQAKSRKP